MRKLIRRLGSSLLLRVALALGLVGLVPVGLLAYRLIDINRNAMEQQVRLTHVRVARSTASEISARIGSLLSLAGGLAHSRLLTDPFSPEARALLGQSLESWSNLGVAVIAVVTPSGERVIQAQLSDERVRTWAEEMFAASPEPTVYAAPVDDDFVIRVAAPIQATRGSVWLVADGQAIRDAVANYELGQEAKVVLATREGEALIGRLDDFSAGLLAHAESEFVDSVVGGRAETTGEFIGATAAVPGTDWAVLSRQPVGVAHQVAFTMRENARWAIGLAGAFVVVLCGIAYASVVRPIRQLALAQRRLAGIGSTGATGEIGQLRSAFEALETRMKEQLALDEVFLGRFQVRKVIGSGAMGTVFLGYDPKLERPVALKTLRLDREISKSRREELLSRLVKEAITTAKFNHPNIVAIYDVEEGEDAAFMAMEFVDGTSLEPYVWNLRSLPPSQAIALGARVARGLEAAHAHGLVHRDIKPANILIGRDGAIKITDFGIAELLSSMAPSEDVVFGTPGYLPPEALQGQGHDRASDLFALGAVLYFCVTGRRPFEGKTVKEVIRKTLFSSARAPSQVVPDVPAGLESLILSLLSSDKTKRPSDAAIVASRLESLAVEYHAEWKAPDLAGLEADPAEGSAASAGYLPTIRLSQGDRAAD